MGREFASVAARWCHLNIEAATPDIVGVSDINPDSMTWFENNIPNLKYKSSDYRTLLAATDIDAVYCAVPHYLHESIYIDIIQSGKHFLGEKPFGIDQTANANILEELRKHPNVFARCASEFPYYPASQMLINWISENRFGRIIEVKAGLNHSSDIDLNKQINWKRQIQFNGEYGCMGDLGIHTQHIPFRFGWIPKNVCAKLQNIVPSRPDKNGKMVPCDTYDNAVLICDVDNNDGQEFTLTLETKRIEPGALNQWYIKVTGLDASAYYTTEDPNSLHFLESSKKGQPWSRLPIGFMPEFSTITAPIFEFGFPDALMQMWAAFILELEGKPVKFACFTPEETRISHALLTAALISHKNKTLEKVKI